jgi:hypothetical protein
MVEPRYAVERHFENGGSLRRIIKDLINPDSFKTISLKHSNFKSSNETYRIRDSNPFGPSQAYFIFLEEKNRDFYHNVIGRIGRRFPMLEGKDILGKRTRIRIYFGNQEREFGKVGIVNLDQERKNEMIGYVKEYITPPIYEVITPLPLMRNRGNQNN